LRESPYVLGKADVTYKNVVKHLPLYESCSADLAYYVLGKAGLLRNAPHIGSLVVVAVALLHYFRKTFRRGVITGGFKARCNAHRGLQELGAAYRRRRSAQEHRGVDDRSRAVQHILSSIIVDK